MKPLLIFVAALIFFNCTLIPRQSEGFIPAADERVTTAAAPGVYQQLQSALAELQKQLKNRITVLTQALEGGKASTAWPVLFAAAFVYGVIHSLGPGHGKAIVASYLVSRDCSLRRGALLGAFAALLHGCSAIVLVLAIYYLSLGRLTTTFQVWSSALQQTAYVLISALGLYLFFSRLIRLVRRFPAERSAHQPDNNSWWLLLPLAMVPCPGTMIVLLFFMSQGMLLTGIVMALCVAFGMASSLALLGWGTLLSQSFLLRSTERLNRPLAIHIYNFLGLAGAFLISLFGLLMLSAARF